MKQIKIRDKEYNCSNMVYYHIQGLKSENRVISMELLGHENNELQQQKEIERLKEMKLHTEKYASEMEDKYILEKSKNDKVIEYIEEDIRGNYFKRYDDEVYKMCDDLLDILKGDNKE